jgi:transposase-like protein
MASASLPCPSCWTHWAPAVTRRHLRGARLVRQALIDAEATQHIGARPYERSEQRTTHRNGS